MPLSYLGVLDFNLETAVLELVLVSTYNQRALPIASADVCRSFGFLVPGGASATRGRNLGYRHTVVYSEYQVGGILLLCCDVILRFVFDATHRRTTKLPLCNNVATTSQ
jgi:hypothetical protein